jgi:serine/threonine protein phosphatase PrpC
VIDPVFREDEMAALSIGAFAQACGLTPKALRLYDELGLLTPARVDACTGYRYYERSQLDRARLIAWLRGIGMPLSRIRVVCDLPRAAAAQEISTYWHQVEADIAARRETVSFLVDRLSGKDPTMSAHHTPVRLNHACVLDRGLVRNTNQDALYAGGALFAVADGFGPGAEHGNTGNGEGAASATAVAALRSADTVVPPEKLTTTLLAGFHDARASVNRVAGAPDAGTTLTALLWSGADFALAHVGDSRAYLVREGELESLTHDHTYVQSLVDEGRLTPEEAQTHPERTTLVRALCGLKTTEPDLHLRQAMPGDRYLLCTDGVYAVVDDLQELLTTATAPQEAVDRISAAAHAAGAPDNLACIVVDVHASDN